MIVADMIKHAPSPPFLKGVYLRRVYEVLRREPKRLTTRHFVIYSKVRGDQTRIDIGKTHRDTGHSPHYSRQSVRQGHSRAKSSSQEDVRWDRIWLHSPSPS